MPLDKSSLYRQLDIETRVQSASPLQLVQMLYEGLLRSLLEARGAMQRSDIAMRGKMMNRALGIVAGLRDTLDQSVASELPANLERLYDYWTRLLIKAHAENHEQSLTEVIELVKTVKAGWDELVQSGDVG